ncbi:hypothetical protein LXL04_025706 [Taraxacum kok-saghyz]
MISARKGELEEAVGLLQQNKIQIDMDQYLSLMNKCGESQALEQATELHDHLTRSIPNLDVHIHNKILEMYSKCGSMEAAFHVFDEMPRRNITSWDTMITWLAKNSHREDAIDMFTDFKRSRLKSDNQMFHGVFAACSVVGDMKEWLLHFNSMVKNYSLPPSMDDYVKVVDMLASSGYLNEALEFIENMPIDPNVEIWEILMNQSRVHGDLQIGDRCYEIVNLLDPSRLDEQSKEGLIPKEKEKEKKKSFNLRNKQKNKIESKEECILSHSERLALSQSLLSSEARATIRIVKNFRVSPDCHNAFKNISKFLGRLIIVRDQKRFHQLENGVCSCGDYW